MGEAEDRRGQKLWLQRLRDMGLEAEPLPGGRSVVARLPLRPAPFPSLAGPLDLRAVRFATVGPRHLKCLAPRPLFVLPLVAVAGCTRAEALEDRIRAAWSRHVQALREAREKLVRLGLEPLVEADGALLAFAIGDPDPSARARLTAADRIALPARGPLAEVPLPRAAQRLFTPEAGLESASDLEIAVTNRLESLALVARKEAERRWTERARRAPTESAAPTRRLGRPPFRLLLVGPLLANDPELARALRQAGHATHAVRSSDQALAAFQRASYDLVLADAELGRGEGIELIPMLAALPGVAHLPVVLVDDRPRPARKDAARRAGAAGYLVHPVPIARVAPGLARMARGSHGRRYARFAQRLAVRFDDSGETAYTTAVGRLGMFVRTVRDGPADETLRCALFLPEIGATLGVEADTLYRGDPGVTGQAGLGVRFRAFSGDGESTWIDYLRRTTEPEPAEEGDPRRGLGSRSRARPDPAARPPRR